jgi:hypothetical protein
VRVTRPIDTFIRRAVPSPSRITIVVSVLISAFSGEHGLKKLLVALALATAVFGAVFAAAATLGLSADNLGADDQVVASCDTEVDATYQTSYSSTTGTYLVDSITLTGLNEAACAGQQITATLSGASEAMLTEVTKACCVSTGPAGEEVLDLVDNLAPGAPSGPVDPELVLGISVVITGAATP